MQRMENRAKEVNPLLKKTPSNNSKTHPTSPSVDQLALCHLLLQGNGNGIHRLSKYHRRTKAPLPGFVGTGTIPTHRPTSPPETRTAYDKLSPSVPAWHQHPELCPLPLPVFPWVFSEAWVVWTIQGVPSHTELTSLCSAPVSTTNNHGSPPLIEALNNRERVPTPPTKAKLPSTAEPGCHSHRSALVFHKSWSICMESGHHRNQLWANGGQHEFRGSPRGREHVSLSAPHTCWAPAAWLSYFVLQRDFLSSCRSPEDRHTCWWWKLLQTRGCFSARNTKQIGFSAGTAKKNTN